MTTIPEITGGEVNISQASPAARCIQLRLMGKTFHPIYTHQIFEDETIRGYVPPANGDATNNDANDEIIRREPELTIQVTLAPSCSRCLVNFTTKRPKRRLCSDATAQKSAKRVLANFILDNNNEINDKCDNEKGETSPTDHSDSSIINDDDEIDETTRQRDLEGNTQHRRMDYSDMKERLSMALPKIVSTLNSRIDVEYLTIAPGTYLEEYERKGARFCLTLANGVDVVEYHNEVQRIARFFIETADDVNVANQSNGGHWKVLYLFQIHGVGQYSLAGYFTLFLFNSPFRKPAPGIVVRICQALVLPPYQRSGHGYMIMSAVYKWVFQGYNKHLKGKDVSLPKAIVEINVEDPAPAFIALRNRVDYQRFWEASSEYERWFGGLIDSSKRANVSESNFFDLLQDSTLNAASAKAKITPKQVQVVYELVRLHQLQVFQNGATVIDKEALEKRYRLMVKKRLQREYREDLGACKNKEKMKSFLMKLYEEARHQYESITRSYSP